MWSFILRHKDEIENYEILLNRYKSDFSKFHKLNIENEIEIEAYIDIVEFKISIIQRDQKMLRDKVKRFY